MKMAEVKEAKVDFSLTTPQIADACMRTKTPFRIAPPGLISVIPGTRISGPAVPVKHYGSVDIFFEAMENAPQGAILVIDNGGRKDEACIGDLTVLEAKNAGFVGILTWGFHRDVDELNDIGFPVFSYGYTPIGPQRLDSREKDALQLTWFGDVLITHNDSVFADSNGAVFIETQHMGPILKVASEIQAIEKHQAERVEAGQSLRSQFQFKTFLEKREIQPKYTFREHLRTLNLAIEE